ncbi:alpha-1,4-glucan:maltose-1-phosphate maltosyltransferase [Nitratireductor aestuarii]|uniref:Alpha-1,4-glucan:maltose-1-phosphate maltosyltransferase n=1 Tax=Nitratireductor aestuarii TaxID=1735103 RepID=A0A916RV77_9HYPH|nr:alpha-1,4-glucan--maltose-1-phosphate maltosyltransferase [Nitratireductor aestuarii]GGA72157.1 alpha-1,4-glucan:maltose-1-phosphate maltosyltransferase [Nitratireductor aestuarii]
MARISASKKSRLPITDVPDAADAALRELAQTRVVIENVSHEIDGGRFPAKAVVGEDCVIEADIFSDGHDVINAAIEWRCRGDEMWHTAPMRFVDNDRWAGTVRFERLGSHEFTIIAWRDLFATWLRDTEKKINAGQDVSLETIEGDHLVEAAAEQAAGSEHEPALQAIVKSLNSVSETTHKLTILLAPETRRCMRKAGPRTNLSRCMRTLEIWVEPQIAGFGAWYELMPRSQSGDMSRHGTFDDVIARLPYVKNLGFDVLYFPPIHPIGRTNRKGPNNSLTAGPNDPGSPYAIGSEDGGHDAIHPELGTFEDFHRLVEAARAEGILIALDFAIQCSPDHPWIKEHPEWFDWRPDGTIKFAENPPKKYEDIVNVHFYREAIPGLWYALRDIVLFWIGHGVTIFRVDNPHTKPFPFWEWMIREVKTQHPEVVFLSEAFTRPKVMKRLAKVGFTQSYTYYTWRNTKQELTEYLTELTTEECRYYMRPNFFVNTPDINPYFLQTSGRPGFRTRLVLAATLSGSYGIYNGYEICEAAPVPGKEEYLDSEKYQLRVWDMDQQGNIQDDIRLVNRLRREQPAMKAFTSLRFYNAWNDQVLYYAKNDKASGDFVLFHVLLDPQNSQEFDFEIPLWEFGLPDDASIEVQDLIHGNHFTWHGKSQRLNLDPNQRPYAIWRLIPPGAHR